MLRALDAFLVLLFGLAALVQFNDPDPLAWVLLYGVVALLAGLALFGRYAVWLAVGVGVVCLGAMALTASGLVAFLDQETYGLTAEMTEAAPYIEQAREFLGAALGLAAAVFYGWRARRHTKRTTA